MSPVDCLPEPALWPLVDGLEVAPSAAEHVRRCAACQTRVRELKEQRRLLQEISIFAKQESCERVEPFAPLEPPATVELESSTAPTMASTANGQAAARPRCAACPARIGPYEIVRLLRVGGQADVYLAKHPLDELKIVVKWTRSTWMADPKLAGRLTDEARLLSTLKHPHLVRVYDLGIAEQRPYLVLEYVDGCELSRSRRQPPSVRQAVRLIAKVARTLHAVHQAGRLHLDLHPDNILVDQQGEPRLIDFGASMNRRPGSDHRRMCLGCGTPEYMPPEQAAGDVKRLDVTADVYALGAILHELLVGTAPVPEAYWDSTISRTYSEDRQAPRESLLRLCRWALEPDPARRPATALVFAQSLERNNALSNPVLRIMIATVVVLWGIIGVRILRPESASDLGDRAAEIGMVVNDANAEPASIRDVLRSMLERVADEQLDSFVVFADGRVLPVRFQPARGGSATSGSEPASAMSSELLALEGTNLLVIAAEPEARGPPRDVSARRLHAHIPSIRPQTGVLIDSEAVGCVASTAGEMRGAESARWRGVQLELSQWAPRFRAVAFRGSAGSSRRIDDVREAVPTIASPMEHDD